MRRGDYRSVLSNWLPVLVWLALIALESSEWLSSVKTAGLLNIILTALFGPFDPEKLQLLNFMLRKMGHVVGYATLSLLLYRALRRTFVTLGEPLLERRWALLAVALTASVSVLDEWHQMYLDLRTGSVFDMVLDIAGALVVQWIALAVVLRGARREA